MTIFSIGRRQADNLPNVANGQTMHQVGEFHEEDEEIVDSYLVWGGIALHYSDLYHALNKQRILHQFLLTVVKSIFQVKKSIRTSGRVCKLAEIKSFGVKKK